MRHFIKELSKRYSKCYPLDENWHTTVADGEENFIANRILSRYTRIKFVAEKGIGGVFSERLGKYSPKERSFVAKWKNEETVHYFDPRNPDNWEKIPEGELVALYALELKG